MKKKTIRTYIYLLLPFLICCSGTRESSSQIEDNGLSNIIDLTAGYRNIQTVRLSEIADSVTFIPFETTRQSVQGQGQKHIILSPSYIFYYSMYYDWNGKYGGTIIKRDKARMKR